MEVVDGRPTHTGPSQLTRTFAMTEAPVALITGANKGIGYETARQLGERGMTVLVGARDYARGSEAEKQLKEEGIDARFVQLDVTDENSVKAAAAVVEREFGRLDVLVNNAGVPSVEMRRASPAETSIADMKAVYEINVFGVVRVTNAMLPLLLKAEAARIVNVSSEIGSITETTNPDSPINDLPATLQYPSSKAAVDMITAQYAKEFRDTPMKINAANPGYTDTDFTHHRGFRTVEEGATPSVYLATLPDDGPSGVLYGYLWHSEGGEEYGVIPW